PARRAIDAAIRACHHAASSTVSGSRETNRKEISDLGLQRAVPTGRCAWSITRTAPAGPSGGRITSDLKTHGCPPCQRRAPRAEITAVGVSGMHAIYRSAVRRAAQAIARHAGLALAWTAAPPDRIFPVC